MYSLRLGSYTVGTRWRCASIKGASFYGIFSGHKKIKFNLSKIKRERGWTQAHALTHTLKRTKISGRKEGRKES